jgi:competence protein ComEA
VELKPHEIEDEIRRFNDAVRLTKKQLNRVRDAIAAAGGFRSNAASEIVNQAAMLTDGLWIYVPFRETPTPHALTPTPAPLGTMLSPDAKVNINTATAEELEALPRIGPALAQRIIAYRRAHGAFQKVDDLLAVKGIGPALLATLRPYVTVGNSP